MGLIACLALGCVARTPAPREPEPSDDDGNAGGAATGRAGGGGAGASGAGAGSAGASAAGVGGGEAGAAGISGSAGGGGDATGGCEDAEPLDALACVHGPALNDPGNGRVYLDETGVVALAPVFARSCEAREGMLFGELRGDDDQRYIVRNEAGDTALTLRAPGGASVLQPDQRVRVEYDAWLRPGQPSEGTLIVRDEDGALLYWLAQSISGPETLVLPPEVSASAAGFRCMSEGQCGSYGRTGVGVQLGGGGAALGLGSWAEVEDYTVIPLADNVFEADGSCFDRTSMHHVALLILPRGFIFRCSGRNEAQCTNTCRPLFAQLEGHDAFDFIECIDNTSCSEADSPVCAIHELTHKLALFLTSCLPPGWSPLGNEGACTGSIDAGTP